MVDSLDVFSCIDVAFLKSCRAFDPTKGKFSTILTKFATGEIAIIRDSNFVIAAPLKVRELSVPVRRLISNGHSLDEVAQILGVTKQACKDAVIATAGVDHDIWLLSCTNAPDQVLWTSYWPKKGRQASSNALALNVEFLLLLLLGTRPTSQRVTPAAMCPLMPQA